MGKYIYALVPAGTRFDPGLKGLDGADVVGIEKGALAFVASEIQGRKLRPERARLSAHHHVLKSLLAHTTPVPMAFGTIMETEADAVRMLKENREAFSEQLERVAGKVEMGLKVNWDVPNIFEYFLESDTDLLEARDRMFRGNREPSHAEKIELGRMFDRALNNTREEHTDSVVAILGDACRDIRRNPPRAEREVMNLACLVLRSDLEKFEAAVFQAAGTFNNNFAFDYSGPWAPHNFVALQIEDNG